MNRLLALCFGIVLFTIQATSQIKLQEDFESGSSLPAGWGVWNAAAHPIFSDRNWTVRGVGEPLPGIGTNTAVSHSGVNAIGVGWQAGLDTSGGQPSQADVWLITRRVLNVQSDDFLRFWATGGSQYADSLQVWVSTVDSTPSTQLSQLGGTLVWPVGVTYGQFNLYGIGLGTFAGQDIWIGFRYYLNASTSGYYVHLDDVTVEPFSSVELLNSTLPDRFSLQQNFPNPFNPSTTIQFSITERTPVSLKVFNSLGEEVGTLVSRELNPGTYTYRWDATGLASGVYFYRLITGSFSESRKMVLTR